MKNAEQIAITILKTMPREKLATLKKACERNSHCTSSYMLENGTITRYEEGYYVKLEGVRSGFSVFYSTAKEGITRKPNKNKLHKVEEERLSFSENDFSFLHMIKIPD